MAHRLQGKKIAFLASQGVEEVELDLPWQAVLEAGAEPVLVSDDDRSFTSLNHDWDRGEDFEVDVVLRDADAEDFDGLVLPGGTLNADNLRTNTEARAFVQAFLDADKPVAAICHGSWILTELDAVRGRRMTSVENIRTDLVNAGADWVDEEFVVDGKLSSSRDPKDLDAFCRGIVDQFSAA